MKTMKIWISVVLMVSILSSCQLKKRIINNRPEKQDVISTTTRFTAESYIERFKNIAIAEMNTNGIPASIKLAQGLLESGSGNSDLAVRANNHFGIKCASDWKGRSIKKDDDEKDECFRAYNNPEDSYKDHSEFLKRKRYAALFALKKNDYRGWAMGLKEAGYATNPKYSDLLISLIERYQLHRFDVSDLPSDRALRKKHIETEIVKESEQESKKTEMKPALSMKIYEVKSGDTLFAIARRFGLSTDELKAINNIPNETLYPGQLLVVSK